MHEFTSALFHIHLQFSESNKNLQQFSTNHFSQAWEHSTETQDQATLITLLFPYAFNNNLTVCCWFIKGSQQQPKENWGAVFVNYAPKPMEHTTYLPAR